MEDGGVPVNPPPPSSPPPLLTSPPPLLTSPPPSSPLNNFFNPHPRDIYFRKLRLKLKHSTRQF